jgi:hypothetical protein
MLVKLPAQVTCHAAAEDVGEITSAGYLSRAGWLSESGLKMMLWSDRHASLGRRRHDREAAGNAGRFEAAKMYFLQIVFVYM